MPIKGTIFHEWHDHRSIPWYHFLPLSSDFDNVWEMLDYFIYRYPSKAKAIGRQGHDWAEKVMRKEDMLLYLFRLLLEYAPVTNIHRDSMTKVD